MASGRWIINAVDAYTIWVIRTKPSAAEKGFVVNWLAEREVLGPPRNATEDDDLWEPSSPRAQHLCCKTLSFRALWGVDHSTGRENLPNPLASVEEEPAQRGVELDVGFGDGGDVPTVEHQLLHPHHQQRWCIDIGDPVVQDDVVVAVSYKLAAQSGRKPTMGLYRIVA